MNGNDDFFAGSTTPPTADAAGTPGALNPVVMGNKEYASYAPAASVPAPSSAPALPLVIGALVVVIALAAGLFGYRALFGGTQIEIPQSLLGLDRIDDSSPLAQQVEQAMSESASEWGDVDVEVGVFQSGQQVLFVMAGEEGVSADEADEFFAGFESGFNQSGTQGTLAEADPGPRGGEMRCITLPAGGTCAWVADDTFGAFAMTPMDADAATTAHQIRDAIEQ
jgi:hypothetical protein